jgi:hypothetical protein
MVSVERMSTLVVVGLIEMTWYHQRLSKRHREDVPAGIQEIGNIK